VPCARAPTLPADDGEILVGARTLPWFGEKNPLALNRLSLRNGAHVTAAINHENWGLPQRDLPIA
jgi:cytochrome c1